MYRTSAMRYPGYLPEAYKAQEILSARPEKLILYLYDYAIKGCVAEDQKQVCVALAQLIDALNFEYESVALGLFRLYEYAMRMAREARFEGALPILRELRETWSRAIGSQVQSRLQRA